MSRSSSGVIIPSGRTSVFSKISEITKAKDEDFHSIDGDSTDADSAIGASDEHMMDNILLSHLEEDKKLTEDAEESLEEEVEQKSKLESEDFVASATPRVKKNATALLEDKLETELNFLVNQSRVIASGRVDGDNRMGTEVFMAIKKAAAIVPFGGVVKLAAGTAQAVSERYDKEHSIAMAKQFLNLLGNNPNDDGVYGRFSYELAREVAQLYRGNMEEIAKASLVDDSGVVSRALRRIGLGHESTPEERLEKSIDKMARAVCYEVFAVVTSDEVQKHLKEMRTTFAIGSDDKEVDDARYGVKNDKIRSKIIDEVRGKILQGKQTNSSFTVVDGIVSILSGVNAITAITDMTSGSQDSSISMPAIASSLVSGLFAGEGLETGERKAIVEEITERLKGARDIPATDPVRESLDSQRLRPGTPERPPSPSPTPEPVEADRAIDIAARERGEEFSKSL